MKNNYTSTPRAQAFVAGFFVPASRIEVTRSAYGNADTISVKTFAVGTPQDWGRVTQKYMPTTFRVLMGMPIDAGAGAMTNLGQVINGIVDEIDCQAETNTIELRGRGALSALLDKRTSVRADMNVPVSTVIRKLITEAGLTPQVADAPVSVGHLINEEYVGMNRNLRMLDFINALCYGLGWKIRANGTTIIVGPPPSRDSVYVQNRVWGARGGERLRVTHSALHAHDVHVKVISYIPHSKSIITANTQQSVLAQELGLPPPVTSRKSRGSGGTGKQIGTDASASENPNSQEYVVSLPGKTQTDCQTYANQLALAIARKEFKMELRFTPTPDELRKMLAAGTEMLFHLTGCPMPSNNGLYYPETINYVWDIENDGLVVNVTATNHSLPAPTGGLPNATGV